jgi:hypothetical protein
MNTNQAIAVAAIAIGSAAVGALATKAIELRSSIKKSEAREAAWIALRDKLRTEQEAGDVNLLGIFDEIVRIGNI